MEEHKEEIYSERIKAGQRTYFFDVKATRAQDYYLTITESKKQFEEDGHTHHKKHKIFLYKEDFNKFVDALNNTVKYVKTKLLPDYDFDQFPRRDDNERSH